MSTNDLPKCFPYVIEHGIIDDRYARLFGPIQRYSAKRLHVVAGQPGCGKSKMLAYFAACISNLAVVETAQDPKVIPYGGCTVMYGRILVMFGVPTKEVEKLVEEARQENAQRGGLGKPPAATPKLEIKLFIISPARFERREGIT